MIWRVKEESFNISVFYLCWLGLCLINDVLISFISSLGTFISMEIGLALTNIIPLSVVNILGSIIMLLLGLYCLLDYRKVLKKSTNHKDRNLN